MITSRTIAERVRRMYMQPVTWADIALVFFVGGALGALVCFVVINLRGS